jgi:retron-type reverse transcriptase
MKRANGLLGRIIEPDNLRLAAWKAAKGKRYAQAVLAYQADLDTNLMRLRGQIVSGQVEVGDYRYFKVYEPKERQICASAFREQVLHHALMNVCHEYLDRAQIFDSYASRKGKGNYAALQRAKDFSHSHAWFLKLDVRKFFESVHHDVIKWQLGRLFKEQRLLEIFDAILDSYEAHPNRGVPIGNLTSQYFANHYLCELDHFIKEKLHIKAYVRYMDDMVLWHQDKAVLKAALRDIKDYLQGRLRCELKPPLLNRCERGLPFLGYRVFPHHLRLLQKSKVRFIRKMKRIEEHYRSGAWSEEACARHAWPLVAFTEHADAKVFRKNVLLHLQGQSS